jgi:hypothetical protein
MADLNQLGILLAGVEQWNKWRLANPDVRVDLRGADLRGVDLQGAGVYLDYPRIPADMSMADVIDNGLRPYPVLYQRKDILNWDYSYDEYGHAYMTSLVLRDVMPVKDGKYGTKMEQRFKRLFLGEDGFQYCEIIGVDRNPDFSQVEYIIEEPFKTGLNYIAFIPLGLSADPFNADLPLEDLIDLNISHFTSGINFI